MRERLCGLDLYRSLAILMITVLHVNWQHCGLIYTPGLPRSVYGAGLFIEYLCFAGVNCFAMLSGYLSGEANMDYGRKWLGRIASFWLKMTL
jgi:peptidoglycan/LPS O-acetylase OafA/YrhL